MEINTAVSCRICKSCTGNDMIKSPCQCTGSVGYVHFSCLEQWLNHAGRNYCELCRYQFQARQSRRYGLLRSLLVWISNPINRTYLCYDLLVALVLTALTTAIAVICLIGAGVLAQDGEIALQDPFVRVVVVIFLLILLASYMTTLYLIVQDHVKPWYRWWRNCVNVTLLIDTNKIQRNTNKIPAAAVPNPILATEVESREMISVTGVISVSSVQETNLGNRNLHVPKKIEPSSTLNIVNI